MYIHTYLPTGTRGERLHGGWLGATCIGNPQFAWNVLYPARNFDYELELSWPCMVGGTRDVYSSLDKVTRMPER